LRKTTGVRRRGKILAVKWGMNPNSSSLGADVTFLLFGATALGMLTPLVAALVRYRRKRKPDEVAVAAPPSEA
jgi:hypothetical protein